MKPKITLFGETLATIRDLESESIIVMAGKLQTSVSKLVDVEHGSPVPETILKNLLDQYAYAKRHRAAIYRLADVQAKQVTRTFVNVEEERKVMFCRIARNLNKLSLEEVIAINKILGDKHV